jgi:DNA modification methylase
MKKEARLNIKHIPIGQVKLNPDNPRQIGTKEFQSLVKSLRECPEMLEARPLLVSDRTGELIVLGGNMRLRAIQKLNYKDAPCVILKGLTAKKEREITIKDNGAWGQWDFDALANAWSDLPLKDWGVDIPADWATDPTEPADAESQIDKAAELNKKWKVKTGDLFTIGDHRLLCGDSTKREDVERVMGGGRAQLVFTDPPYGVGMNIENDDLCGDDFDNFNSAWAKALPADKDCGMVCYHSTRTFPSAWLALSKINWKFERMLWYYRPDKFPTHSWNHWMMVSQAIMLFSKGKVDYADTESDQDCYRLTSTKLGEGNGHPTEKMSENAVRVMGHFVASIIYDPFLGSGTTTVACQNLSRKCRGIEISPNYCAVILQRMTDAFPDIKIEKADGQ